jgi:hypothetical protein
MDRIDKINEFFDRANELVERHGIKFLLFAAGYFLHGILRAIG